MIDQFWSPRVNKRTDEWGGSFENRMRFGLEVIKAVRKEVGPDFCVGLRICGDEFHPDGLSHEDMKQIAKYYDDTGMIDFSVWWARAATPTTLWPTSSLT